MKKYIMVTILAILLLSLTACGSSKKDKKKKELPPASEESTEQSLSDYAEEDSTEEKPVDEIQGGTSMESALPLQFNKKYYGKYTEGEVWFSFTTGQQEEVPYMITAENLTVESNAIEGVLYDEYGTSLTPTTDHNNYGSDTAIVAEEDGTANSCMFDTLMPDTTYYLRLTGEGRTHYSLRITDPNGEPFDDAAERKSLFDSEVFEVASNMDEAPLLQYNTRYEGKYESGYGWVAFTTGQEEEVPYMITVDNLTVDSNPITGILCDEYGAWQNPTTKDNSYGGETAIVADEDGKANTCMFDALMPDTTYYLRLTGEGRTHYSLRITDPNGEPFDDAAERKSLFDSEVFEVASNMDEAPLLQYNTRYKGKYESGYGWAAFTTGQEEEVPYTITVENLTVGSESITGILCDEYGAWQNPTTKDNSYGGETAIVAGEDGTANTCMFDALKPDTTYYLRLTGGSKAEYIITVRGPEGAGESSGFDENDAAGADSSQEGSSDDITDKANTTAEAPGVSTDTEDTTTEAPGVSADTEAATEQAPGISADTENTTAETFDTGTSAENNTAQNNMVIPGTSQSSAVNLPLGTMVFGKYESGYAWLKFTTTDTEDAEYYITVVNCTVGSDVLTGRLYDEYGTILNPTTKDNSYGGETAIVAGEDGTANTCMFNSLEPNTSYYIRLQGGSKISYSLVVNTPNQKDAAYSTSSNLAEARGVISEQDSYYTETNQNDAPLLKTNVTYHSKYEQGYSWVAFKTGDQEDGEYTISVENLTVGSDNLIGCLYDEYGTILNPTTKDNSYGGETAIVAGEDGTVNTCMFDTLKSATIYYLRLKAGSKVEYKLTIGAPKPKKTGKTPKKAPVFEVPFELNETQVKFVANEATFVDEASAKEALEPVAKIILAHPDHKILLAGTTATFGDQKSSVDLSNRRAGAVKDLLVESYGVAESQLVTKGLGFEDDPFVRGKDIDSKGNFVETEGAKNRRVVVLDADSKIGKKILGD